METGTPIITEMSVIPVAGQDSMLMTLSGAHAPFFTRNLVILKDSAGHTGVGEIHGGDYTCESLKASIPFVVGKPVGTYRQILNSIHKAAQRAEEDDGEGIQTLDLRKLKFVVKAEWAIECALLDLLDTGKYGSVLRAKGIVPTEDGTWLHFDYVPGEQNVRTGAADYTGRLCVIGAGLDTGALAALFSREE